MLKVRVHDRHDRSLRGGNRLALSTERGLLAVMKDRPDSGILGRELGNEFSGPIRASVVHDEDLERGERLLPNPSEHDRKILALVEGREDDRDDGGGRGKRLESPNRCAPCSNPVPEKRSS